MRSLAILLLLFTSVCSGQNKAKTNDILGAWIVAKVDWPQDDFHKNQKWTNTEVLYFYEDGRFGIVYGSIVQMDNTMEISYGDAQTVYFGNWKQVGSEIAVNYKLVYCDVCMINKEKKIFHQGNLSVNDDGEIVFQKLHFKKEPRLDKSAEFTVSEKLPSPKPQNP